MKMMESQLTTTLLVALVSVCVIQNVHGSPANFTNEECLDCLLDVASQEEFAPVCPPELIASWTHCLCRRLRRLGAIDQQAINDGKPLRTFENQRRAFENRLANNRNRGRGLENPRANNGNRGRGSENPRTNNSNRGRGSENRRANNGNEQRDSAINVESNSNKPGCSGMLKEVRRGHGCPFGLLLNIARSYCCKQPTTSTMTTPGISSTIDLNLTTTTPTAITSSNTTNDVNS